MYECMMVDDLNNVSVILVIEIEDPQFIGEQEEVAQLSEIMNSLQV